jgi:ABC-type uncharacterized transport system ATPase subunit
MAVIEVQGLRKRYGDKIAVEDVSFSVERGEIFGILGPNGAGKTTTVECLEGLRKPDHGTLSVLGLDPHRETAELRQRLGVQLPSGLRGWVLVWDFAICRQVAVSRELKDHEMSTSCRVWRGSRGGDGWRGWARWRP